MKNNTDFEYIDELLSELEDTIHGDVSDRITIARSKLQALSLIDVVKRCSCNLEKQKTMYFIRNWCNECNAKIQ